MEIEKRSDCDTEYLDLVAAAMLDDRELEGAASLARDLKRIMSQKEDTAAGVGLKEAIKRVDVLKVLPALESLADGGGEGPLEESGDGPPASDLDAAARPTVLNSSGIISSPDVTSGRIDSGVGSAARQEENLVAIVDFLGLLSSRPPNPPPAGSTVQGRNQTVQGGKGRLGSAIGSDAGRAIGGEQLETFMRIVDVLGLLYPNKTQTQARPLFTATQAKLSRSDSASVGTGGGGGSDVGGVAGGTNLAAMGRSNSARNDALGVGRAADGGVQGGALGGELFMSTLSRFRLVPASMPAGQWHSRNLLPFACLFTVVESPWRPYMIGFTDSNSDG